MDNILTIANESADDDVRLLALRTLTQLARSPGDAAAAAVENLMLRRAVLERLQPLLLRGISPQSTAVQVWKDMCHPVAIWTSIFRVS